MPLNEMAILRNRPKVLPWKGRIKHPVRSFQQKEDGMYISILKDEEGIRVYGRKPQHDYWKRVEKVLSIWVPLRNVPVGTVIEGELISLTGRATDVRSFNVEDLKFVSFAMPVYRYTSYQTNAHPSVVKSMLNTYGFLTVTPIELAKRPTISRLERYATARNIEGVICKNFHYDEWYKVKPVKTADCKVVGWTEGTKRLKGKIGSLSIQVLDKTTGEAVSVGNVGTGLNDYERSLPYEKYHGKIIEVVYDKVEANGGLRFPRFKGIRSDKDSPNYLQELG